MKKRMLSLLLAICMVLSLVPTAVFAEGGVEYRYCDENGKNWQTGTKTEYTVVSSEDYTWGDDGNGGWYVATGNVTIESRVTVSGNVHLILTDGCKLTVNGGIKVQDDDNDPETTSPNALTIYAQSDPVLNADGTVNETNNKAGKLTAKNGSSAIGGDGANSSNINGQSCGIVTINGGIVEAISDTSAGIGGGNGIADKNGAGGSGGIITINGGNVIASGDLGAGIGGGMGPIGADGGIITINGGTVKAGSNGGSGIGGGYCGGGKSAGAEITINGGNVTATSNNSVGIGGNKPGPFSTGNNGNAVIFAKSIAYKDNQSNWSGIIFEGDNDGIVYGTSVMPTDNFTIPTGKTLTIGENQTITIPEGKTLTNEGTIDNSGKIFVDGSFTGTADNLYYPLTLENATAAGDTSDYNNKTYGKAGGEIALTQAKGYELKQWSSVPAVTISENKFTMPGAALKVAAQVEPIIYDIDYVLNGGTATPANPIDYTVESDTFTLNNPAKTGYIFTGWSGTDLSGSNNMTVTISKGSIGDRAYTAHYAEKSGYSVEFDTEGGSNISDKTNLKWTDKVLDGITAPTKDGWEFTGWKCGDVTVTADTTYSYLAGIDTVMEIELTAQWNDITAPTGEISIDTNSWTEFLNNITFGLFFKDTQEVTITASDNSGEDVTIEYLLSDKELTADELENATFTAYNDTFGINPDNEYVIYARLTDKSGNYSYINSDGIVLDSVVPVISGVENGKTYCEAQTVTVMEEYVESVKVNGTEVTLDANNQFTLNEGTHTIVVTDKAGNVSAEMIVTVNDGHTDENPKDHKCDICEETISDHTYQWQSENGQYWKKCSYCGDETEKKDIPAITISGADVVCKTQDYRFVITVPEGVTNVTWGYDFERMGNSGIEPTIEDGEMVGIMSSDYYASGETGFRVVVMAETADGFVFAERKSVVINSEHADNNKDHLCDICEETISDHTYEWQSENGQYWQKCSYCGDETEKKDIPAITIDAPDTVCKTQNCEANATIPDDITEAVLSVEFARFGGAVDITVENGMLSHIVEASTYPDDENSFNVVVYATTADGFPFEASKTVQIQDKHAGGKADCVNKAVCDTCGEEYGEVDSTNHNLEHIPAKAATVTENGNTEYWHCKDCDKCFADENGEKEIELSDTIIAKLPPEIIDGMGQSVTEGEKKVLSFTSNAAYSDFVRVEIDGETLDAENYTATEGSTIISLTADYVATLSAGKHTIGIVSESGTATTTFTVNAKTVDNPDTGDNSHMILWIALALVSGSAVIGTTIAGTKKKRSAR